jgi:mannose-6-phosphate isomerase-like protein (cupin superfamily)
MPIVRGEDRISLKPLPGWSGRAFHAASMTFVEWDLAEGAAPLHAHHHEQEEVWHVLDGEIALTIQGVEHRVRKGMAAVIPPNVLHSARPTGPCRALVCDHPRRESLPGAAARAAS